VVLKTTGISLLWAPAGKGEWRCSHEQERPGSPESGSAAAEASWSCASARAAGFGPKHFQSGMMLQPRKRSAQQAVAPRSA